MTQPVSRISTGTQRAYRPSGVGPVGQHTLLKEGRSNGEVRLLQQQLIDRGLLKGPATGSFDAATTAAVKEWQRQNGLQVDGIVGQQTWGSFNGEKYPPGAWMLKQSATGHSSRSGYDRPDATPVDLTPGVTPTGGSAGVDRMLDIARSHLGFREGAGNVNPFSRALGRPPEAWCADFVSYLARQAGHGLNTASAQGVQDYLTRRGTWKGRNNPEPGDAITFDWAGRNGWADHVGIVEKVFQRNGRLYVQTIEGNSSNQVRRKTYAIDDPVIKGFGRIV